MPIAYRVNEPRGFVRFYHRLTIGGDDISLWANRITDDLGFGYVYHRWEVKPEIKEWLSKYPAEQWICIAVGLERIVIGFTDKQYASAFKLRFNEGVN